MDPSLQPDWPHNINNNNGDHENHHPDQLHIPGGGFHLFKLSAKGLLHPWRFKQMGFYLGSICRFFFPSHAHLLSPPFHPYLLQIFTTTATTTVAAP
ncbi:hypothetical protein BVC80_6985g2 [Macleaya cordata]|uniref:Uncharacterized protein n=1 Tax=Macleaya cordata TaxID=56857 RepID=A0A200PMF7_MACCD|nr:hypothetical protein BVC80_6985g2 [Macleaya cordata]